MLPEPYYQTELGTLYHGDCLEIMREMDDDSVDALITDPPFAFAGGLSNGMSSSSDDQFFKHWWGEACGVICNVLRMESSGFIWCDWRTARIFSDGFVPTKQTYNFFKTQMVYHFREMPGMGRPFRSSVDMILYLRGPKCKNPPIEATTLNFISEYWYYGKHEYHPAEKSASICERFLRWCSVEGDLIADPFFGSGTTAVACERLNRRWIGIEISKEYCDIAVERIKREVSQLKLEMA